MRAFLLVPAAASLALAGCGSSGNQAEPSGMSSEMDSMDEATADADAPVTAEDAAAPKGSQAFVNAVASGDLFEIESSKLAVTSSANQAVKDFAAMMIRDHTASSDALKAAAAAGSPAVTVTPMLDTGQDADLAALKASGANFDKLYVESQVGAHEKALALLQAYASSGEAPALKQFATRSAAVVEGHLKMVRGLRP